LDYSLVRFPRFLNKNNGKEMNRNKVTIDGNEAAAYTSFHTNEVIAIYPITPSSNMG